MSLRSSRTGMTFILFNTLQRKLTSYRDSLERIKDYIDIQHEPPSTEEGKPPAAWPTSGQLVVDNLSARYSPVCWPIP